MTKFLIFARKEYQQPLELIGELRFDGTPPASEMNSRARSQFDGDWLEMVAIPESSIIYIIPTEAGP